MVRLQRAPVTERARCTDDAFHALDFVCPERLLHGTSLDRRTARRIGRDSGTVSGWIRGTWDSLAIPAAIVAVVATVARWPSYGAILALSLLLRRKERDET